VGTVLRAWALARGHRSQRGLERDTPWGRMSYIDYRFRVELGLEDYLEIDRYYRDLGIDWTASCWDEDSIEFMERFEPPFYKLASTSLTDLPLLRKARATGRPVMISTGMSTAEEIRTAVEAVGLHGPGRRPGLFIAHSTSTYPCKLEELNLRMIPSLKAAPIGYSGHETGLVPTGAAVALGGQLHQAPYHARPRHVGHRSSGLGRDRGLRTPGAKHPRHRNVARRRRQARLRQRVAREAQTAPRACAMTWSALRRLVPRPSPPPQEAKKPPPPSARAGVGPYLGHGDAGGGAVVSERLVLGARIGAQWRRFVCRHSPLNANIAPPGYYMLFALRATGVPSVSKIMKRCGRGQRRRLPLHQAGGGFGGQGQGVWLGGRAQRPGYERQYHRPDGLGGELGQRGDELAGLSGSERDRWQSHRHMAHAICRCVRPRRTGW
jgi:hypothetical protein